MNMSLIDGDAFLSLPFLTSLKNLPNRTITGSNYGPELTEQRTQLFPENNGGDDSES